MDTLKWVIISLIAIGLSMFFYRFVGEKDKTSPASTVFFGVAFISLVFAVLNFFFGG